tara:strand:+ start:211 stop:1593 length:1383 start_codon:yes stop_codon:yes gene_type:complete
MLPLLSCVASAPSYRGGASGSLEPGSGTGGWNTSALNVSRTNSKSAQELSSDFAKYLAEGHGVPTDYTCEVDLNSVCKTGVVQDASHATVRVDLMLAPGTHLILYGSSHMKEIGIGILEAHRMANVVTKRGNLEEALFKSIEDPDLSDCDAGSDVDAGLAYDPAVMKDWAEVGEEDAYEGWHCNKISAEASTCKAHIADDFQRFTFSTGAALTLVTNYGPLQRTSGQARLEQMLPHLKMEGLRNVAFVQAPHVDEYFDQHCKKQQDESYQPTRIPNTFQCVIEDGSDGADRAEMKLRAKLTPEKATKHVNCVVELPFYKAFTSEAQQKWLETTLMVPWMYEPGAQFTGIYEMGRVSREYRCSVDEDVQGRGTDNFAVKSVPGTHLCMVVCQDGSDDCYAGPLLALASDMLQTTHASANPTPFMTRASEQNSSRTEPAQNNSFYLPTPLDQDEMSAELSRP